MLQIHFSNRYEALTRLLLGHLGPGRGEVFAPDQVIVPSAAVQRSLTLALARAHGVCANVEFGFLAQWLWRQMGRVLPDVAEQSPFAPAVLAWRVHQALADAAFVAAHPRLAHYLGGADELMRYELACRVATLLEQYVTYRPDWLDAWRHGRAADLGPGADAPADEAWQAALWRRLAAEMGLAATHPGRAFVQALAQGGATLARRAGLPAQAHVFALPSLPPLHVELLAQIGRWMDLHVYVLNPCREYWFELVDRRRLAWLAARGRAQGHEEAHRLLAAWGRQTQALVDGLYEHAGDIGQETLIDDDDFEPLPGDSLLARWQNGVLELAELAPGSVTLAEGDRSIELHVCHSLTRELEVLQDHLLGLVAGDDPPAPGEVLVVTPDLEAAAPLIDAVFGTAPEARRIPYAITGRARGQVSAPARALLALLALAGSRCTASDLFGLLQQPIVARRFGLDDAALQQLHDALRAGGLHWGLDGAHRAALALPATERHTVADALDRLFLGYALPTQAAEPFAGLLPAGASEGSAALVLGAFWRFASALQRLHGALATPQTPAGWQALLLGALADFTAADDDALDDLSELQDSLRELAATQQRAGMTAPLPTSVLRAALVQALDPPARGGVPTGSVTFASLNSLRSLPYAVVCVIGLDDGRFPGTERPPEFDLMALRPRRGDRQRRTDERNLFLDLLLAARRSVYLSHTGRSVRDNAPLPPSVLVTELLDVLVPAIAEPPDDPAALARARQRLVVQHPLQPFSADNFRTTAGDPRLRSFQRELADALLHGGDTASPATEPADAAGPASVDPAVAEDTDNDDDAGDAAAWLPPPRFFATPLPRPGPEWRELTLAQLVEFFRNPCRALLRRRLALDLPRPADELQDDEPFLPDWPGRTALAQRLLPALLAGAELPALERLAQAGTELPLGALGREQRSNALASLQRFAARVQAASTAPCLPPHQAVSDFVLDGERWRLSAAFADLRPTGLLRWRYDELRAGDVLEAWLQHLALCAAPPPGVALRTQWLALDGSTTFRAPAAPAALLAELLRLYRRGLSEPLPFFPKAAWAYVEHDDALPVARQVWQPTPDRPHGEGADAAYRLALRGVADPLAGEFAQLARTVFGPAREHLEAGT